MKRKPVSTAGRVFWGVLFVAGLISLTVGVVFLFSGMEMIVLTVLFGGLGAFLMFESFGRMLGWEK